MDKKNTTIGVLLMIAAFATIYIGNRMSPPSQPQPVREISTVPNAVTPGQPLVMPSDTAFAAVRNETSDAQVVSLSNDYIEAHFTSSGGALRDVALKHYDKDKAYPGKPYVVNELHAAPALSFVDLPGLDSNTRYSLVSQSPTELVFRAVWENRVEVLRRYSIVAGSGDKTQDPYQIRYQTAFRSLSEQTIQLPKLHLSVGTAAPLNAEDPGLYLSNAYHGDGTHFIKRGELEGGGFFAWLGFGQKGPIPYIETQAGLTWASVQNQFFVSLLTPDQAGSGLVTRRVELHAFPGSNVNAVGMTGAARFELPALAPKGEAALSGNLYVGPKEYKRLSNSDLFKNDQDAVMDFGFFSFFSKILLTLMSFVHGFVPSWGWAIVLTTLVLKIVFLPLTIAASKSAKRMAKIQPEMTALREKYKDDAQKMQLETMALFKKHKVNPMGGCLPILVTIPFFIGFFSMLQSTSELRFQEFLWAVDLSAPDTVTRLFGIPINIMPVLMGATMIIQMRLTPQPTVDNMQAKMFKFMPYIFALFCYNFSCALSLYSTVNGIFTIGQQLVINRMKDEPLEVVEEKSPRGRKMKNVTPGKKG
jgi:YidC/Oxa1 family membrane protein insertase